MCKKGCQQIPGHPGGRGRRNCGLQNENPAFPPHLPGALCGVQAGRQVPRVGAGDLVVSPLSIHSSPRCLPAGLGLSQGTEPGHKCPLCEVVLLLKEELTLKAALRPGDEAVTRAPVSWNSCWPRRSPQWTSCALCHRGSECRCLSCVLGEPCGIGPGMSGILGVSRTWWREPADSEASVLPLCVGFSGR